MAKKYAQKEGINFSKIFLPMTKIISIYYLLSIINNIVAIFYLKLEQLNVTTTFLHSKLNEDIYIY